MSEYLIKGDTLTAWANHARRLSNVSDLLNAAEIAEIISRTVGTIKNTGEYEIRALSQGGTVEKSGMYDTGEVFALPKSSGRIYEYFDGTFVFLAEFDKWVATSPISSNSFVTADDMPVDIGPIYKLVDDCIIIVVNIENDNTTISIRINNPETIDWGDGVIENIPQYTYLNSHTYTSTGKYLIKIPKNSQYRMEITTSIGDDDITKSAIISIGIPKWINDNVSSVITRGFDHLSNLKYIMFEDGVGPYVSEYNGVLAETIPTLRNTTSLEYIHLPKSILGTSNTLPDGYLENSGIQGVTLPYGITSIPDFCFCICANLTNVVIPDSVTNIGISVFYGCTSLEKVVLSKNVTVINAGTFRDCSSLSEIVNLDNITRIEHSAFDCSYHTNDILSKLILPSVVYLGPYAFCCLNSLKTLVLSANTVCELEVDNDGADAFNGTYFNSVNSTCNIYVPDNLVNSYKSNTNWSIYSKLIKPLSEYIETADNSEGVTS